MRTAALVFGILGGVSAVLGGLTIGGAIPLLAAELTWVFWFGLSAILLLASIAFAVSRGGGE